MSILDQARDYISRRRVNQLSFYQPYPWQTDFHSAGLKNPHRAILGANRGGKTYCNGAEIAIHATGEYPAWWKGRRWERAVEVWTASVSNELQRKGMQKTLLGGNLDSQLGTGIIPKRCIASVQKRQAGIANLADIAWIKRADGTESQIHFKSYEQGDRAFQSGNPDIVSLDEQPDEHAANEKMIFSEAGTRIVGSNGMLVATLTPLLGETDLTRHFMHSKGPGVWWCGMTWDDAPHLTAEARAMAMAIYPEHEVQTRTTGVPMMGEGKVFSAAESAIKIQPFQIPDHFRCLVGVDFGTGGSAHPFAGALIAYDADNDIIYVAGGFRSTEETSIMHAAAIKERGWARFPVAWPHDGLNKKDEGHNRAVPLWVMYQRQGLNMLPDSARYSAKPGEEEKGGGQPVEPIVLEIAERERTGRFKVFATVPEYFEERRSLHRKDGRIVAARDDLMKAVFYASMMLRYAVPHTMPVMTRRAQQPSMSMWG